MPLKRSVQLQLLILVVLVVYFPAINDTINSVDDSHIIEAYSWRTLQQILTPTDQFYYRPITEITFFFDNLIWGMNPRFMHLENVLLHLINTLLVYSIAKRVATLNVGLTALPFMSALLFAIHPINTEPVSWIAGRTDLLAATFIMLSLLLLTLAAESGKLRYGITALFPMACSFLTKETSLMLVPASLALLAAPAVRMRFLQLKGSTRFYNKIVCSLFLGIAVLISAIVVHRLYWKPAGSDNAVSLLFKRYDILIIFKDFFGALGFYVKKLIIPYPLNFAIDHVSNWYVFLGLVVLLTVIIFPRKDKIMTAFLFLTLLFMVPAAAVKVAGITWTPVAERYLYIPSAFFCTAASNYLCDTITKSTYKNIIYTLFALAAVVVAFSTYHRNNVWQDNLLLFQDAVSKSPRFGDVHNELGVALAKQQRFDEARKHFEFAASHAKRNSLKDVARFNLLLVELQNKPLQEKRSIVEKYRRQFGDFHKNLLLLRRDILRELVLSSELSASKKIDAYHQLILINDILFSEKKDSQFLYFNGQYALVLKDKKRAYDYFSKVVFYASNDTEYFINSSKLLQSLTTQISKK